MDEVQQNILTSAVKLFATNGFKSVRMDDIAASVGISKKTLYQNFDNKNILVLEVIKFHSKMIELKFDEIKNTAKDTVESFVKINILLDKVYEELNPLALMELQRFYPKAFQIFINNLDEHAIILKLNIDKGIEEANYRAGMNTDIIARLYIESILNITTNNCKLLSTKYKISTITQTLVEEFFYGISTIKGQKLYNKYKEQFKHFL